MTFWVYMLQCADGAYYVGSHRGEDLAMRVSQHNTVMNPKAFTYARRPARLVWSEDFQMALDMVAFERRLKGWSRAKKAALIHGDWVEIQRLARSPRPSTSSG